MSQDPYPSERPSGSRENPYDGGAFRGSSGYGPYSSTEGHQPPYQQGGYQPGMYQPGGYQPGMYQQGTYRTMEGEKAAQLSLILGLVGFFVAGIILGPLAIWQARKAERLGVPATAGKVLGWIVTALYAFAALSLLVLFVLLVVGLGTTAGYSS